MICGAKAGIYLFLKNAVVAGVRVRVRFDTYPTPNLKTAFFK